MCVEFRAYYIRPDGNSTGSLGIHPEDVATVEQWRERHDIQTPWKDALHPNTGVQLMAFRPIEGRLLEAIEFQSIEPGQLCRVTYRAKSRGGRSEMWYDSIHPEPTE